MFTPTVGRWLSEDPAGYVDGPNVYLYVGNQPVFSVDPSGYAICDCCNAAIAETKQTALKNGNINTGRHRCRTVIECKEGCPANAPGYTTLDIIKPKGGNKRDKKIVITICIDCRVPNTSLNSLILHEVQHARDFCDNRQLPPANLPSCVQYETSAYEVSCGAAFPDGGANYQRCIDCGVWFSCRRYNAPQPQPPCNIADTPAKPCYIYDPVRGFIPDPDDPRCEGRRRHGHEPI